MEKILKRVEMIRVLSNEPKTSSSSTSSFSSIIYPETMTESDLTRLLDERLVKMENNLSKEELIKLAYRFCVPKPQREYSRRGSVINTNRISTRSKSTDHSTDIIEPGTNSHLRDTSEKKRVSTNGDNGDSKRRKHSPIKFP